MSTWFLSENNSDLTFGSVFNRDLVLEVETANTVEVLITGQSTSFNYAYTPIGQLDDADWADGDITVEVNVTTANMQVDCRILIQRRNSAGVFQEASSFTGAQSMGSTGVLTFLLSGVTWTAGNADDRLNVQFRFENGSHGEQTVGIETGTVDTEITASPNPAAATALRDMIMAPGIIPFTR
jgi:hypothetical protein